MRNNNLSPDKHQIIHPHPRPFLPTTCPISSPTSDAQLGTDFPAPIQEYPNVVALLHLADATWAVRSIVKDERNEKLRSLHGFLAGEKHNSKLNSHLRVAHQRGFGAYFRGVGEGLIGTEAFGQRRR